MTEQQPIVPGPCSVQAPGQDAPITSSPEQAAAPQQSRRLPGEPHPYMLERNPPNLWILVALTIFSLALTFLVLALTVVL